MTHVDARGVVCATEAVGDASAAAVWTRQVLDATGQATAVIDARGNEAFTYVRDLRGRVVAQTSVDAGAAWAVADGYDRAVWESSWSSGTMPTCRWSSTLAKYLPSMGRVDR